MNSKHINQYKCEVCDSPLSRLEQIVQKNQDHLVCYFPDCKVVIRNKTIMDPTLFKLYLNVQKKTISKRKGEIAAKNAYASEICQKEMIEDQEILQSTLKNDPLLSKDKISVLTIPSAPTTLRQITDERIKNYTAHLKDVISEASKHANASEVIYDQHRYAHEGFLKVENNLTENTALRERSDRLCGICKGGCCPEGRDKAFVSVITVRRYMDSHYELTGDDI
ncbi:MAG: hypothetical protein GY797_40785, partial [Deltaproteobacteria bacterium]|nr:hypothetical protein [Deltaproteobacteria bacterium]